MTLGAFTPDLLSSFTLTEVCLWCVVHVIIRTLHGADQTSGPKLIYKVGLGLLARGLLCCLFVEKNQNNHRISDYRLT